MEWNIIVQGDVIKMVKKKYLILLTIPLITLTSCGRAAYKEGNYKVTSIDKEISSVITKDMKMECYKIKNSIYLKDELEKDFEKLDSLKGYMVDLYYDKYTTGEDVYNKSNILVFKFTNCGLSNYPVIKLQNYMMPEFISEPIKDLYKEKHYTKGYLCEFNYNDSKVEWNNFYMTFKFYLIDFEYDEDGNLKGDIVNFKYEGFNITDEVKITFQLENN
jgi:hypothetical protein